MNLKNWKMEWAMETVTPEQQKVRHTMSQMTSLHHWSRKFEYPWVWMQGDFHTGQWILDAAGGDAPMQTFIAGIGGQVINVDIDPVRQTVKDKGIIKAQGDLRNLTAFADEMFDRVLCVSVLEHIERPLEAVVELWRVLRKGGKLVVSFDVASYARWNHTIDMQGAEKVIQFFGQEFHNPPLDTLSARFPEIERQPQDPEFVDLRCLCFCCEKT